MDFVASSAHWLRTVDPDAVAPGMIERLTVAANRGRSDQPRSIAAPYYLTDLGVRKFEDPRLFTEAHLDQFGPEHRSEPEQDAALLLGSPMSGFAGLLDALVLLTGDYTTAHVVVAARFEELVAEAAPSSLVQVGVLLAALGDERARPALRRASDVALHPTDRFMALHRLAAAEIKRFGRPDEGVRILADLDLEIEAAATTDVLSSGDRETLLSVTANLRALALLRSERGDAARAEIMRSRRLHTLADLREVAAGEAARYGAQERINVAQVLAGDGELAAAVEALEENLEYCRACNVDYVGEALTALAYGQFRAGRFVDAARTAADAALHIAFEASPTRLRGAREIEIAALFSVGDIESAQKVLASVEADPLGLTLSRPELVRSTNR